MARKIIDIGIVGNDGTGDSIRDSFRKVNENFYELYGSLGLGERLAFTNLGDTPDGYEGLSNDDNVTAILTVNDSVNPTGLSFKKIRGGAGINVLYPDETHPDYNANEIVIQALLSQVSSDINPSLGGNLTVTSGQTVNRIINMVDEFGQPIMPLSNDEAVNKAYTDTKVALAGVDAIIPATGLKNPAMGRMTGPLILSRNPNPDDDIIYDGLIAATKQYVDNAAFGSASNLFVATSGDDYNINVARPLRGSNLAYAFRSIEAALQRADELVKTSPLVMGPYGKPLTYNSGNNNATLTAIETSPNSGTGFSAKPLMSVDTIELANAGLYYYTDDILTLDGGTVATNGQPTIIQVLSTASSPGPITAFKVLSSGVYDSETPGTNEVTTTTTNNGQYPIGSGATFNVTYKVNNIEILTPGSGYSLVSVRIVGEGNSGFGTAVINSGEITDIIINNPGEKFTNIPTIIADLPRFLINTDGLRTDASGIYPMDNEQSYRTRDIYNGLYIKGNTSGALAQILIHEGELNGNDEIFDVDIISGTFELGETLSYGDVVHEKQINVIVESGVYKENLPLKIPTNVAVTGDGFNRIIIKPKHGFSASQWAFQKFRRDLENDGLTTATQLFGYHYLTDSSKPVYPKISNVGNYTAAATLIDLNKDFILEEMINWIEYQINNNIVPFDGFEYIPSSCKKDLNIILDAISYDIRYGEYNRIVSTGLRYYQSPEGLIKITEKLEQMEEILARLNSVIETVIKNEELVDSYQETILQSIDKAYIIDTEVITVITDLFLTLVGIINNDANLNKPLDNNKLDVFLCNDGTSMANVTSQGHGGFMVCLDPEGRISAKSPEIYRNVSMSQSKNKQVFAGGMFIDGFAGNIEFTMEAKLSNTQISVSGLERIPQLPTSFIVNGVPYRVNYIRNFVYNPAGSTADLILDITTPWTDVATGTYELLPPGTRTVIAKDFVQINDMGYGVLATNNSTVEITNVPTDYCYTSIIAANGAKIKSASSKSAHGVYGLVASGADPYEVPKPVSLNVDPTQSVVCYAIAGYENYVDDTYIHVYNYSYEPLQGSELEIQFGTEIYTFTIASVTTTGLPAGIAKLNLSANEKSGIDGLLQPVAHDTKLTYISKTQLILSGNIADIDVRPSTALRFNHDLDTVYRILQIEEQSAGISKVILKENFEYVNFIITSSPNSNQVSGPLITDVNATELIDYKFVFLGEEFIITDAVNTVAETTLTLNNNIDLSGITVEPAIAIGPTSTDADAAGKINVNISVTEAISHTFHDVGTGSYADTNLPPELYGKSVNITNTANEVLEKNVGRVFYTSVDQYGNFNVGPYLKVDQGTGQVSFSAAIALSNLDGLGFRRGVTISEFSIDPTFADNSISAVPTESAIRGYIDKRLGIDHDGIPLTSSQTIPAISGGFLPLSGTLPMKGDINLRDADDPLIYHKVTNLADPVDLRDAVNLQSLTFENLQGISVTELASGDVLTFNSTGTNLVNATLGGDFDTVLTGNDLTLTLKDNTIDNDNITSSAGIVQSKLSMNIAQATDSVPSGTAAEIQAANGLASFNSTQFIVNHGRVNVKENGLAYNMLRKAASKTVLGNSGLALDDVSEISFNTIIDAGGSIKKSQYTSTGILRRKSSISNVLDIDYELIDISSASLGNKLIQRDTNGDFAARIADLGQLKIDGQLVLDSQVILSGGAVRIYGWTGLGGIMIASGPDAQDKTTYYDNNNHKFRTQDGLSLAPITASKVTTTAITAGSESTPGTIEGYWSLVGNSRLESTYSADLAEYYEGDKEYPVGTVLVFGGEKEVTVSNKHMDTRIAGVVSHDAAFAMYKACPGYKNLIALQGRVPCRVVGKIQKGDLLVTSAVAGVAISVKDDAKTGSVIGKALENYDSDHIGLIEVAVGRA